MALKLVVDALDEIPEAIREMYTKGEDGKFKLQVEGIEDPKELRHALKAEREARKKIEDALKAYDGADPAELKAWKERIENDEELQLIRSGNKDKLRDKWTEKMRTDFEKKLKLADDAIKAEAEKSSRWSARVLDNAVREAAAKVGVHAPAIEDALFRARAMFTLDENGNAVQVRNGSVVLGKDGSTPYGPAEWMESMREAAPHWFPATSQGGGAQQSQQRANSGKKTLKRAAFMQLDPTEQMNHVKEGGVVVD